LSDPNPKALEILGSRLIASESAVDDSMSTIAVILLAGGLGSRLGSDNALQQVAGKPLEGRSTELAL
jgi:UDP-N-acetylglucosamine pyrophosphorylase